VRRLVEGGDVEELVNESIVELVTRQIGLHLDAQRLAAPAQRRARKCRVGVAEAIYLLGERELKAAARLEGGAARGDARRGQHEAR
jgi:hypothetical protein